MKSQTEIVSNPTSNPELEHLQNLGKIVTSFKRKYNFNEAYLSISGGVQKTSHSRLHISCINEFDKMTLSQIKEIEGTLYENLRKYLEKNKISKTLILRDAFSPSWHKNGTELIFETSYKV
jgi:hypothetical protein